MKSYLLNPQQATNFNRTEGELQLFLLFAVAVAGKNAKSTSRALELFLGYGYDVFHFRETSGLRNPFDSIREMIRMEKLETAIKICKLGQHNKLSYLFRELVGSNLDLKTCSVSDLEKFKYISAKTSRYFILHSRQNQKLICPDTHIKKKLTSMNYELPKVFDRKNTPYWDGVFSDLAASMGKSNADLDLEWWNELSANGKK